MRQSPHAPLSEQLLWAAAPFIRTRTLMTLFAIWSLLLVVPVFILVEHPALGDAGGWAALAWAIVSVFIFVPRVSRSSRLVFALTSQRAFTSERTMYCSIETAQIEYKNVTSARLNVSKDQTGSIELRDERDPYAPPTLVHFYGVRDLRNCCRVLNQFLPQESSSRRLNGANSSDSKI